MIDVVDGLQLSVWAPGFPVARTIVCAGKTQLVLGRSSSCDVQLPLALISGRHLELRHRHGVVEVSDLGSTNGTMLDGMKLKPGVFFPVSEQSVLSIQKVKIVASVWSSQADVDAEAFTIQESGAFMRQLVVDAIASEHQEDVAYVQVGTGSYAERKLKLEGGGPWGIGQGEWWPVAGGADLARVEQGRDGTLSIKSRMQGVWVDEVAVVPGGGAVVLGHGARIKVGAEHAVFQDPLEMYLSKLGGDEDEPVKQKLDVSSQEPEASTSEQEAVVKQQERAQEEVSVERGVQEEEVSVEVKKGGLGRMEWVILGVIVVLLGSCVWLMLVLFEVI